MTLQAWSNGYEVFAAESEAQARELCRVVVAHYGYEGDAIEEYVDGGGWHTVRRDLFIFDDEGDDGWDDDGNPVPTVWSGQSVEEAISESAEPRHLWSCDV